LVTSDEGDVRLALPPDFAVILTANGVVAQPQGAGVPALEVLAAPAWTIPPPGAGVAVREWLEQLQWLPSVGTGGITSIANVTERETILPAGAALVIGVTAQVGADAESRVVVYVISTEDGPAVVRIIGDPGLLEERAAELRLITDLAEFGAGVGGS
jgi:hypothetical protein